MFCPLEPSAIWTKHAHEEGVYSVDMNKHIVASGGDDSTVKIWSRCNGDLLHNLEDLHEYIVWSVKLWSDGLFTAGYDCIANFVMLKYNDSETKGGDVEKPSSIVEVVSVHSIQGPLSWADALGCDQQGKAMTRA